MIDEEQMRGWMTALSRAKSRELQVQVYARLLQHLATFRRITMLGYDFTAAEMAERFRQLKLKIGAMDLRIAAIVATSGGVLVTRNAKVFREIPDLQIEDWSANGGR